MPGSPYGTLWKAVEALEGRSWEAWRKQHYPSLTIEGTIAQRLTSIETTVSRRPKGLTTVTVSFLARKVHECEVYCFYLQRAGNRHYIEVDQV